MKTLVVPDIHNRVAEADRIIAAHPDADKVIFLGDYFDNFDDTPRDAAATARWLRHRIEQRASDVFLLGNHDVAYRWPGVPGLNCCGWTPAKQRAVDEFMRPEHWRHLFLHHWEPGEQTEQGDVPWLLSHAGINRWIFQHPVYGDDPERINAVCAKAIRQADAGIPELAMSAIGHARGGRCQSGGITWQCWSEFNPTPGINQIVGHTPDKTVRTRTRPLVERMLSDVLYVRVEDEDAGPVSENWNLDTHNRHYGILEDGTFSVHETPPYSPFANFAHAAKRTADKTTSKIDHEPS